MQGMDRWGLRISLALVISSLLFAGGGCRRTGTTRVYRIAVVTKALDSEFWLMLKRGAEAAARAHPDVEVTVLAPEREINIDQQVAILEDQILKKVSALIVAPAGAAEVIPVLNRAKAAGIPVLLVDTDAPWPEKLSYIGTDNRLGGKLAGEYIVRVLGGTGKVAVIRGILGVAAHEDRVAGFQDALARAPGIELVTIQPANSERALAMTVMENILTSHPDLRAVFATNDQMALGAMEAIAARNLTGKVILVGFDATQEAVRAVKAGQMHAVVAQHPFEMGRRAVEAAIKVIRGEPIEKRIDTGTTLVTRENADEFLQGGRMP
ncbi:MAG: sugar ABC transporter substrate-binding protein [Blastocatellia bacterium]|nr:sugar ABC transporter substrate-binding protein [Blastocatellia bacterium]MCS7156359.1 sugar ABC transporter substrate-binding protein [Blastocatellia bacterium]MCX7751290.1 sugar ABC transporter substrate-binding protein [Blastocatellia bacterium]MDW8169002.1 sugar ABC transporter substrate-binding protein [Acidobacteriota bacterium]MDW8256761.1 sugar ABC transporter substrate-binding protein [Acidobacteriota bacterium]